MGKSKKKQFYDLYYSINNFLLSQLKPKVRNQVNKEDVLADFLGFLWEQPNTEQAAITELSANVEWAYMKNDSPAIFPESEALLEKLFHSKYLFKDDFKLTFPFKTFQVAMPKGFEVDGKKIPAFIVNIGTFKELLEEKKEFLKSANLGGTENYPEEVLDQNERYIQISISGGKSSMGRNGYLQIRESMLPLAVKSRNVEEYVQLLSDEHERDKAKGYHEDQIDSITKNNWEGDPKDSIIEFSILKIIAVLNIYLSATESVYLKKGLPGSHLTSVHMIEKIDKPLPYLLRQTDSIKKLSNSRSPDEHYRIFHFRNLKADKYYQGEYEHLEKGSRWVFVKDSLVNSSTKGHTPIELGKV